jgi:hypothetical protein
MMRVIELFGLAGAGKSTLAEHCVALARDRHGPVYSRTDLRNYRPWTDSPVNKIRAIAAYPSLVWWSTYLALRSPPIFPPTRSRSLVWARMQAALYTHRRFLRLQVLADHEPDSLVILEEGMVHWLCAACAANLCHISDAARLAKLFHANFDVLYVFCSLPPTVAAARACERGERRTAGLEQGSSAFDGMTTNNIALRHEARHPILMNFYDLLLRQGANVLALDAARSVNSNAILILERAYGK